MAASATAAKLVTLREVEQAFIRGGDPVQLALAADAPDPYYVLDAASVAPRFETWFEHHCNCRGSTFRTVRNVV